VTTGALVGQRWGVTGVAVGVLVAMGGNYLAMALLSLRLTGLGWAAFWRVQRSGVQLAAAVLATTLPTVVGLRAVAAPSIVVVLLAALVAGGTELVVVRLAPRIGALAELAVLTRRLLELVPQAARIRVARVLAIRVP
jgi:PST family polysaccharide transporter